MDNNYNVFRRATFGGFNRKDVIDYIERIKNEFLEYKNGVEKTIAELRQQISELTELAQNAQTQPDAAVQTPAENTSNAQSDTIKVISEATAELISVADGLSKSLGDFVLTITQGEAPVITVADEALAVPQVKKAKSIDDIVSGFCFVSGCEQATEIQTEKAAKTEPLDPLASAGFFAN